MNTSSPESVANTPSLEGTAEPTPPVTEVAHPCKSTHRKHRPHRSKITELPADLRTFVNQSLNNNIPYSKICKQLAEKGHPGFNTSNIGRWVDTGFAEWLKKQERVESVCLKMDNVKDHVDKFKSNGMDDCIEFNRLMLAAQLTQTMHDFDPRFITNGLAEKPGRFYKLARLINTQVLERQRQEKIQLIREKLASTQPTGSTPEGEQAIRLAFGIPDSWSPAGTREKAS
jgi:hypothetical protein